MKLKTRFNLLLFIIINFYCSSYSQQIPNGGFEVWDTTFFPPGFPVNWLTNGSYVSLPCYPPPNSAIKTNDANSGNWAAMLQAQGCVDDVGQPQVYIGFVACGDMSNPNLGSGISYNQRPAQLNFYYKFNKVGTDTGFAKIILRHDSAGYAGAIIGKGQIAIINDTNNYTQLIVPINYFSADTPQILQIVFATSKTLADHEFFPLNSQPGNGAYAGTTLWVDDVTVSGGTLPVTENINNFNYKLYPNPAHDIITLTFGNYQDKNFVLKIFDVRGILVRTINHVNTKSLKIMRGELYDAIYFYQLIDDFGLVKAKGKILFH